MNNDPNKQGYNIGQNVYGNGGQTGQNGVYWRGTDGNVYVKGSQGVNSAGRYDSNTDKYWFDRGFFQIQDPYQPLQRASTNTGVQVGGSGGVSYDPNDIAMLDQQQSLYERLLQSIDAAERYGLEDLNTSETQSRNKANLQRERQLEDFGTKREDFTRGQDKALNQVGDNSRTLRASMMRRLGLASGGGSAFDVADTAVARDATKNRSKVQETYGENFRNLATAEKRGSEDFESLLAEIANERRSNEERFRSGILGQRQGIQQSLAELAADRARVMGGNQRAASQPYVDNYLSLQGQIDQLPAQFNTKVSARDLNPQQVSLRDYIVDRANIGGGQQKQYSPYSQFLRPQDDEEEQVA